MYRAWEQKLRTGLMISILSVVFEFFIKIRNKDGIKLSACSLFVKATYPSTLSSVMHTISS